LSDRWVYTARSGLAKGMRLKGGFQFLPKPTPKEASLLESIAPTLAGKVVYDIGANIGITTLFFARWVGAEGVVVAFEPTPPTAKRLIENLRVNRLQNVRVYELALGNSAGHAEISYAPEASGIATLRQDMAQSYQKEYRMQTFTVEVVPLDMLVERERLPLPNFIKIDVEGFEYQVLQGAQRLIERAHPALFLELHGASAEERAITWRQIYDFLSQYGYAITAVNGETITADNLLNHGNLWYCTPARLPGAG
ncbi:MAG: FkbM family methyltransferase, partial [Fimbriimonadales bacterium]